ncbi:hypothetical protein L541_0461 [Bordetella hinzii CA90 BAL1384]|uniref:Uncharacterized protein n=1 Tax=Bordetella hinzii OH87 BAL007II TaxID=1331262 RepID=A0ABR4R361_9BORD|nr:hypothetical protein L544_0855 [Bordetella hinzii OH87 BAL007II]KCB32769.1 hypothetical protein L541_0461 [Bordetella hinzii CA90 BAL1384]KCB41197.1 hypothetical protein L538_0886 [Bordetella hinzii 4161]KCB44224.1 hypothetical protein L539_1019 [Bordetella hinzii 5132]
MKKADRIYGFSYAGQDLPALAASDDPPPCQAPRRAGLIAAYMPPRPSCPAGS